jgi:hypothetical protein
MAGLSSTVSHEAIVRQSDAIANNLRLLIEPVNVRSDNISGRTSADISRLIAPRAMSFGSEAGSGAQRCSALVKKWRARRDSNS